MKTDLKRRRLVLAIGGVLVAGAVPAAARREPTPAQTAGPFYPVELPLDRDNDLTRVAGASGAAIGRVTDLTGRVLDVGGRPVRGARIEIWQCDANGRYHHPRDEGPRDPNFQGFGHTVTDPDGRYRFRTIRPVPYPGRTPHIHMAVFRGDAEPFVTQLYVKGEPRNAADFLFGRIPPDRRGLVMAEFVPVVGGDAELQAVFDVVLAGRDGTPAG
ncbi:intradiol ring-cleavage dioxygenase [Sulfurifustis variabilis]|uniref:Intradiol ring-cleavage dioxygenase n=1 Tax=Sulfurifustis variabilis TaxID=1675686 RepID=A0A1B4V222_9GAMM|nr:protocatechuate 3,4-dioxygenase [Sulfurifustis variabilis]BAU47540.1 intradiol ring-cleavage dioxygenase [Sulfurifustis variabilis]